MPSLASNPASHPIPKPGFGTLDPKLEGLVREQIDRAMGARGIGVRARIRGLGVIVPDRDCEEEARAHDKITRLDHRIAPRTHSAPIEYGGEVLGKVEWISVATTDRVAEGAVRALARDLAFLIVRHEVARQIQERLGQESGMIGTSPAMRRLEEELESAARSDLPVVVEGEFGLEKPLVAGHVHFAGTRRAGPFCEIQCRAHRQRESARPEAWLEAAHNGTLYFHEIDQLDIDVQRRLPAILGARVLRWSSGSTSGQDHDARLIASTGEDAEDKVSRGEMSRALLAELSFLRIRIPPLRQRREDLRQLAFLALDRHRSHPEQRLTTEVIEALERYDWPGNLFELEQVVARLATMASGGEIGLSALEQYAPKVAQRTLAWSCGALPSHSGATTSGSSSLGSESNTGSADGTEAQLAVTDSKAVAEDVFSRESLARRMAAGKVDFLEALHPGLQSALRYIVEHYDEPLSMVDLARASFISASHLSFLFRSSLGLSFKALLAELRIEHAKELLIGRQDLRITDICLEVGFRDLSHFEKTFKRLVRLNPREFRRRALVDRNT